MSKTDDVRSLHHRKRRRTCRRLTTDLETGLNANIGAVLARPPAQIVALLPIPIFHPHCLWITLWVGTGEKR